MTKNITFVVFTFNEERRIERVIKNFMNFGNILIADNKSTDKTVEIARAYGCDIYIREKNYIYVENQELVDKLYEHIKTEWIYWAFADEMLDIPSVKKLVEVIDLGKYDVVNFRRKNYFEGEFCYNIFQVRTNKAFKKNAIDFTNNKIHGMGNVTVPKENVYYMNDKYFVHNFSSHTASHILDSINRYSEEECLPGSKPKVSVMYIFFQLIKKIIKNYFFEKGYKAKYTGLQMILTQVCYEWFIDLKKYEKMNKLDKSHIEYLYDQRKDEILLKDSE
jgi:glycosyltransferase involved in cell wall biosynthesis